MKPQDAPRLERRRAADFERELLTRARTWIPSWNLDEGEADFGLALLKTAARFNSEVAERLDRAGEKMALGFLDWLGLPALAARPARLPIVLKMAETAREPVLAQRPVKMQVDVGVSTLTFETETDLQVIPGQLAAVVAVDPAADGYYEPPPGLMSLDPLEPLPTAWKLKNFAAAKSKTIQVDPGIGLSQGMLVEIEDKQFQVVKAKDDLVTIDPPVPEGDGFEGGARITKVETFRPFEGARNLQEHILYIGDSELLNIEAKAKIEIGGLGVVPQSAIWEYWGKSEPENPLDADPRWRELKVEESPPPTADALVLEKPEGAMEPTTVGIAEARWIRARLSTSKDPITTDGVTLRINPPRPTTQAVPPPTEDQPAVDIFVNSTASTTSDVYLFGQEPRLFDTFYVGCEEAFSKTDAIATIDFKLSDGAFNALATIDGVMLGNVLAAVDQAGALHLFSIGQSGRLMPFAGREPMRPSASGGGGDGSRVALTSKLPPVMWMDGPLLYVAVVAESDVWIWTEVPFLLSGVTGWSSLGTVPSDQSSSPVDGIASVFTGTTASVVALRNGALLIRALDAASNWQPLPTGIPDEKIPVAIASMRPTISMGRPDAFLVLTKNATNANGTVYSVEADGSTTKIFDEAAVDVVPFGLWASTNQFAAVAVRRTPDRLSARTVQQPIKDVPLDDLKISNTTIDGKVGGVSPSAHCVAKRNGDPVLVTWLSFDSELKEVLFTSGLTGLAGDPAGPVSVIASRAFLPGNRGEILSALIGASNPRLAGVGKFQSAIALDSPPPALSQGDVLTVTINNVPEQASIASTPSAVGIRAFSDKTIFWLNRFFDVAATSQDVQFFFATGQPTGTGQVQNPANAGESILRLSNALPAGTSHLLVRKSPGPGTDYDAVEIVSGPDANNDVTVSPVLSAAPGPAALSFWAAPTIAGRVVPSLELDASNNDFDSSTARSADIAFPLLTPRRQETIAIATDPAQPSKPQRLAFATNWISGVPPAQPVRFFVSPASSWSAALSAPATNPALAWEYWNGTGWWHLPITDDTDRLRESGSVEFIVPDDLKPVDWAGKTNYWIRARLIRGDYGEATVEVLTEPAGQGKTKQTVDRDTSTIHAPYALSIGVSYTLVDPTTPTFLLTKDSGSTRDQSDANRTPGARVEIFTPLSVTLGHLDAPAVSASSTDECVPDCECDKGDASMSPASELAAAQALSEPASASGAGRRAIYLGFTSKLLSQPVTVLFNVARESDYDANGPLRVDALIGDRFAPIVSTDDSRALGETGIVTMAFDVAPVKRELFGQVLSWLRLAPRIGSTDWKPSLAGVYPNGVWARSAETMTRELLGSSDGRPLLTVTLARPPLLQDSLELRVREPLGEEERNALTDRDPNLVKSNVTDLLGDWVLWTQVNDPTDHGPKDRVYALDEATGTIRFGDGRHGMIPPAGIDGIVAFKYERTEPAVGGRLDANFVTPRTELNLVTPVETVETVVAAGQSAGGVAPESPQHVLQFAPATLRHRGRAVSLRDFEDLARQKSDEVVQARAFRRNGRVRVVVVTKGANPGPNRALQRELRRTLLEIAPVALGARNAFTIAGPRLRRLRISLVLRVLSLDVGGTVANEAKRRLGGAFDPVGGWSLGRSPRVEDIAEALIDIPALAGIVSIGLFEVDETGAARPWQRPAARDELIVLAPEEVRVGFDVRGAAA